MPIPDNWFRDNSPADIVTMAITTVSLATISKYSVEELVRIGWYFKDKNGQIFVNPTVDKLFTITSAGVWIARTDSAGKELISDLGTLNIIGELKYYLKGLIALPNVSDGDPYSSAIATKYVRRVTRIPVTLDGAGQALNTILIADPASAYYPVLDGFVIKPNAGCAIAGGMTMLFESPAGTAIETIVTAALVENVPIMTFLTYPVWNATDNEALVVDITGSGGAGDAAKTFTLIVFYHYET